MRDQFPERFRPRQEEFEQLWEEAFIALDANVLLNLYRYTPETRDEFLRVMEALQERLWAPHQAVLEFFNNRMNALKAEDGKYHDLVKNINSLENEILKHSQSKKHPVISDRRLVDSTIKKLQDMKNHVSVARQEHFGFQDGGDVFQDDRILGRLEDILQGRVGEEYSDSRLQELYVEGKNRYSSKIPPGYEDFKDKDEPRCYGDWLLWKQCLEHAKENEKPFILITGDEKEDWWTRFDNKKVGPRWEIIRECALFSGQKCYLYSPDQFLEQARKRGLARVPDSAIQEAQEASFQSSNTGKKMKSIEKNNYWVGVARHVRRHLPDLERIDKMLKEEAEALLEVGEDNFDGIRELEDRIGNPEFDDEGLEGVYWEIHSDMKRELDSVRTRLRHLIDLAHDWRRSQRRGAE